MPPTKRGSKPSTKLQDAERVYARYVQPLERQHLGAYVAVSPAGEIFRGTDLVDVAQESIARFGPGVLLFRIGERATAQWRTPRLDAP